MAGNEAELSPGITASEVLTGLVAKGGALLSGAFLGNRQKEASVAAGAVSLAAESDWLRQVPSPTALLLDVTLFTAAYFALRPSKQVAATAAGATT